ncbi:MAG: UDP-N-acetylmuramoyl-L-alanine--D-glutamate ligase [Elusimicrobia bacterium]|nr:UDP-N-acetylmuramoyl-L-alanine--D-glutamate ligase [Elusimicrobiota bacterium]MBD3412211.1 UDP-N-acetylmuramoyl-L-alanine--D-glutamate ligase [Elusimicrobiota bacterium]
MTLSINRIEDLANKNVTVIGAGKTGVSVSMLLSRHGARVMLADTNEDVLERNNLPDTVRIRLGPHTDDMLKADLIIKSPGIASDVPILQKARKAQIPVWDELELVSLMLDPSKIIAITGTNGKTTTTALVSFILNFAGVSTLTAGNIGVPISSIVDRLDTARVVVLEISSYQLECQRSFKPHIAAVLNLSADHLERHKTMDEYQRVKERIFHNQSREDYAILNHDDMYGQAMAHHCPSEIIFFSSKYNVKKGVYADTERFYGFLPDKTFTIRPRLQIPGEHNIENALAATACTVLFGIEPETVESALAEFPGVRHRLELIGTVNGIHFINDSKATNVHSTIMALKAFHKKPVWLILGGRGKGASYKPLKKYLYSVKGILLIGEDALTIKKDLGSSAPTVDCFTIRQAVAYSFSHAKPGDTVLLSPACASFDQYKNFEERGDDFRSRVKSQDHHSRQGM